MKRESFRHIYGPVPSRRLGRSLGIDLVPLKTCSFDCLYCQLGRTTDWTVTRKEYVPVEGVLSELAKKLAEGNGPDYISLAGSGEPTLHSGLGKIISGIKEMTETPVAVLTNGSLLWMDDVQDALSGADLVIPSLDAGDKDLFAYINRPHRSLSFDTIVDGLTAFTRRFMGGVWLEVLLLEGITGIPSEVKKIATLAERVQPRRVQLNTASRPPAEKWALAVPGDRLRILAKYFTMPVDVISEQGDLRTPTSGAATDADILALLGRRPCTPVGVATGLGIHVTEAIKHLDGLLKAGKVTTVSASGELFYAAAGVPEQEADRDDSRRMVRPERSRRP